MQALTAALVSTPRGRFANVAVDFSGLAVSELITAGATPLVKPYLSLNAAGSGTSAYVLMNIKFPQGMNFAAKNMLFSFRPNFINNVDQDFTAAQAETFNSSVFVFNQSNAQTVCIGDSVAMFQNYFDGAAWQGLTPKMKLNQGCVPFFVDGNQDTLDLCLALNFLVGGTFLAGKLQLNFADFDIAPWTNSIINMTVKSA